MEIKGNYLSLVAGWWHTPAEWSRAHRIHLFGPMSNPLECRTVKVDSHCGDSASRLVLGAEMISIPKHRDSVFGMLDTDTIELR